MQYTKTLAFSILITIAVLLYFPSLKAQGMNNINKDFGLGVMFGEPTGVSIKVWTGNQAAFDVGAAWSLSGSREALHLHADILRHSWFAETVKFAGF